MSYFVVLFFFYIQQNMNNIKWFKMWFSFLYGFILFGFHFIYQKQDKDILNYHLESPLIIDSELFLILQHDTFEINYIMENIDFDNKTKQYVFYSLYFYFKYV